MLYYFLLTVFVLATITQLYFWFFIFKKLADYDVEENEPNTKLTDSSDKKPLFCSILICAKNEEENLQQNIPRILNQNYRSQQILVVNDNSHDKSLYILKEFQKKCSTFDIINLDNMNSDRIGKKFALSEGITHAKHDVLLLTDADCWPVSDNWSSQMVSGLKDKEVGLGYSPYTYHPGFLNLFIRFETVWTAVQYLSFSLAGHPYMGVGRNLIYKKELFYRANGFKSHEHIASGDDDLFINAVAHKDNTTIILHPDTFMLSEPKKDWRTYIRQKQRHLSTGKSYQLKHKTYLGLLSASHFLHYIVGLILAYYDVTIFFTLFAVRMLVILWMYRRILKKLNEQRMLFWIPFLDVAYIFFYLFFATALMNTRNKKWN